LDTEQFTRTSGEGLYTLEVDGQTYFSIIVYKSGYIEYNNKETQRAVEVVRQSQETGIAGTLAQIFSNQASDSGATSRSEKVNWSLETVQSFPYVSDSLDTDYDDVNKYPVETLVEGGGDCEDTTILLATVLGEAPINYGTALIYLPYEEPEHVAVGVEGNGEISGRYYEVDGVKYYYAETTGEGWTVGEMPEKYHDVSADVQVI
jgi:hypothetical protein